MIQENLSAIVNGSTHNLARCCNWWCYFTARFNPGFSIAVPRVPSMQWPGLPVPPTIVFPVSELVLSHWFLLWIFLWVSLSRTFVRRAQPIGCFLNLITSQISRSSYCKALCCIWFAIRHPLKLFQKIFLTHLSLRRLAWNLNQTLSFAHVIEYRSDNCFVDPKWILWWEDWIIRFIWKFYALCMPLVLLLICGILSN